MKKNKETNSYIGKIESGLKKSKKDMIREFYENNAASTEALSDIFFKGEVKCGLAFIINLILYKLAEAPSPFLADFFKFCTGTSCFLAALIAVLAVGIDIHNHVSAHRQYKLFREYLIQTGEHIDLSVMNKVVDKSDKASRVTQLICGFTIIESEDNEINTAVLLAEENFEACIYNDDFVQRICDLDTQISALEYDDKDLDDFSLYSILKEYALYLYEENPKQEVADELCERLDTLEVKISKIMDSKKLIKNK